MTHTIDFLAKTPAQKRQAIAGYVADGKPYNVMLRNRSQLRLRFEGVAQDGSVAAPEPDEWSERGSLAVCRFDYSGHYVIVPLSDIRELAVAELYPTDPRHPDYVAEPQVVKPLPRRR